MIEIAVSVICYDNENEVLEFANKLSRQKDSEKIMLLVTCNKCKNVEQLRENLSKIKYFHKYLMLSKTWDIYQDVYTVLNRIVENISGLLYRIQISTLYPMSFLQNF